MYQLRISSNNIDNGDDHGICIFIFFNFDDREESLKLMRNSIEIGSLHIMDLYKIYGQNELPEMEEFTYGMHNGFKVA